MGFADDTAIRPEAEGRWLGSIAPGWDIGGNANGGYLLALVARGATAAADRPDPLSVTAHYLAPGRPGPVTIEAEPVAVSRRFTTVRATLSSPKRPLIALLGVFGDLTEASGPERVDAKPPELPPPDACARSEPTNSFPPPFVGRIEQRLHPDDAPFAHRPRSGRAEVRAWLRLLDGEPVDTMALLLAADAFPPPIFNTDLPVGWMPTLEITVHVRARPVPGWLRGVVRTHFVSGGFLEVDGELWDAGDRLVAQSRQLALVPRTTAGP